MRISKGFYTNRSLSVHIGILFLAFQACKTIEPQQVDHPDRISIGSFGGFAGSFDQYDITEDGSLFYKNKINTESTALSALSSKTIKQLTKTLKDLKEDNTSLNSPGNMTYFIKLHEGDEEVYEWIWGGGDEQPDNRLRKIYKILTLLAESQKHPTR